MTTKPVSAAQVRKMSDAVLTEKLEATGQNAIIVRATVAKRNLPDTVEYIVARLNGQASPFRNGSRV